MSEIDIGDGEILVRTPKGAINRVPTPRGFTDFIFRSSVSAFDTAYRTLGKVPTVDDIHAIWSRIPKATYAAIYVTPEFRQALQYRGIEWDVDEGLSMEQAALLHKLTDFTDKRSIGAKLKELGIPMARYTAWQHNHLFAESMRIRTEKMFNDAVPLALNKLLSNMDSGDQRAVEKVLEITGRWNPAQQQVEDVKRVVVAIVESVIKNVRDPEVRRAIMADVQSQVAGYTLLEQSQIGEK